MPGIAKSKSSSFLYARQKNNPLRNKNKDCWGIADETFNINSCHFGCQCCEHYLLTMEEGFVNC